MNPDYLWEARGEPDPEVQRLEQLLSEFRPKRSAPARSRWPAIAAGVLVAAAGAWIASRTPPEGWHVARTGSAATRLAVGQTIETGANGHATLAAGDIGVIEVEPNSRLRLLRARHHEHRMALDRGLIRAFIWAPPRSLVVDTPSAAAVDLGCYYTLQVDADGAGLVSVLGGWVGFERHGRESFIPAGARCQTRPGIGPGTPYRAEASPALRRALQDFDFAHGGDAALDIVLAEATKEDAFTLWHLLTRADAAERPRVYDALAGLVAPPPRVTRQGVLRGERGMLDRWWNQLGLGHTSWWRRLESPWPAATR
jgi:FecR protein